MIIVNKEGLSTYGFASVLCPWSDNGPQRIAYCVEHGMTRKAAEAEEAENKAAWARMAEAMSQPLDMSDISASEG